MTNFFSALIAAAEHFLPHVDNVGAKKILAVIDEARKIADSVAPFIPIPQVAVVDSIIDEVDAVAHKIVPVAPTTAPAPVPAILPMTPLPVPTPTSNQVLAADLERLSQDLLK